MKNIEITIKNPGSFSIKGKLFDDYGYFFEDIKDKVNELHINMKIDNIPIDNILSCFDDLYELRKINKNTNIIIKTI